MKKMIYGLLAVVVLTSLMAGCSQKPSEEEVRSAIASGTLTVEDAVAKGYVTDEWVTAYRDEKSIAASDKFSANLLSAFSTTDVNGAEFTFTPSDMPVFFAFADPTDSESLANIQTIEAAYEEIKAAGGDVVLMLMDEKVPEDLSDCSLPTIFYTDDIKKQLGSNTNMIDGSTFSASWSMKGSFITAWYRSLDKADLPHAAKSLLETFGQPASDAKDGPGSSIPASMVG